MHIGFAIPIASKASCIRLTKVGCVVLVLHELLLPLSSGIFIDIVPFSGTINLHCGDILFAIYIPAAKNNKERERNVLSVGVLIFP